MPAVIKGTGPAGLVSTEGVLPEQKVDLYVPLWVAYPVAAPERGVHFLRPVLRLRPGVTAAAARADLASIFETLARLHLLDQLRDVAHRACQSGPPPHSPARPDLRPSRVRRACSPVARISGPRAW